MTALVGVSAYLPPTRVPISALADKLGLSGQQVRMFERFYGLSEVRMRTEGTIVDLLLGAASELPDLGSLAHRIRFVLHARTVQAAAPYPVNPLHEVRDTLGLDRVPAFAVTQHACASGLLAVDLAGRMLTADGDGDGLALVLTGEKALASSVQLIPNTTIMGEGSAAALVAADGRRDRLLSYVTQVRGRFHRAPHLSPELSAEFEAGYLTELRDVLDAAVDRAGMRLDQVDLVLPHNVNRLSWVRLCKLTGFPVDRVLLDNVPWTGHCFSADSFINYRTAVDTGRLRPGDRFLMAAVGLGATFSAMVFEH